MARFKIYSKDGKTVRYEGAPTYHGTYLSPSYLEFSTISSPVPIAWEIGDYVEYSRTGLRYSLYSIPQPTKKASRDKSGESFVYSSVQLYDFTKMLDIAPFRDLVKDGDQYFFSSSKDISTYETLKGIADRIKRNMDEFAFGTTDTWVINLADGLEPFGANEMREFSVSGVSCLGALSHIYDVWDTIGWSYSAQKQMGNMVYTITIGAPNVRTSGNTTNKFEYGFGNGLTAIRKTQINSDDFATRLYVYGSTKNMIEDYYRNLTGIYGNESVNIPNLMIPTKHWGLTQGKPDASKAYLQANSAIVEKYGIVPKTIYLDGGDEEEIVPTIKGETIADLWDAKQEIGSTTYVPSHDKYDGTERLDTVLQVTTPATDNGVTGVDGSKYTETADITIPAHSKTYSIGISAGDIAVGDSYTFATHTFTNTGRMRVNSVDNLFYVVVQGDNSKKYELNVRYAVYSNEDMIAGYRNAKLVNVDTIAGARRFEYSMDSFSAGGASNPVVGQVDFVVDMKFTMLESSQFNVTFGNIQGGVSVGLEQTLTETFGIRIRQIGFNVMERASLAGMSQPSITFNSGKLAGRTFPVSNAVYDPSSDSWVLTCKRSKDTSTNMVYPNTTYQVAEEDVFVFTDIAMPEEYIGMASARLYAYAEDLLAECSKIVPFYEPQIDSKRVVENIKAHPQDKEYILLEGKYMHIKDVDITDGDEYVIIDSLTINEGESNIPTYSATLRSEKTKSILQTLSSRINRLNKGVGGNTIINTQAGESTPSSINGRLVEGSQSGADLGLQDAIADAGNEDLPVYFKGGQAKPINNLVVDGYVVGKAGVAAYGIIDPSDPSNATSLRGLLDVSIYGESEGQVLTWDDSRKRWVNRDPAKGLVFTKQGTGNGVGNITYDSSTGAMVVTLATFLTASSIATGQSNGTISVNGTDVKVKGLGSSAYTNIDAFVLSENLTKQNLKGILEISDWALAETKPDYTFSEIGGKPTTIAGYGITDAKVAHVDNMSYVAIGNNEVDIEPVPIDEIEAIFTL